MAGPLGTGGFEPRTSPAERRDFFDLRRLVRGRMLWKGPWVANGQYDPGEVVRDDGWTMICVDPSGCTERPSPQPIGDAAYVYDGNLLGDTATTRTVIVGQEYTWDTGGYVQGYRVYLYSTYTYDVLLYDNVTGQLDTIFSDLTAQVTGWSEFSVNRTLIAAGETFTVLVVITSPGAPPSTFTSTWDVINQNGNPGAGQAIRQNSQTEIRVNHVDSNSVDQKANLESVAVGGEIETGGVVYTIVDILNGTGHTNFFFTPSMNLAASERTIKFSWGVTTPAGYAVDNGFWATPPTGGAVRGAYTETGLTNIAYNDNQYGIDLLVQGAEVSNQWDVVAAPPEAAGVA